MSFRACVAAAMLVFVAACGGDESEDRTNGVDATPSGDAVASEVAQPVSVAIPAIDVDAELVELGLNDDGSMETPEYASNLAGWYIEGPKPGEPGPAVIAAHVDNSDGPDTFARLHELEPGDEITVTDAMGNEYTWTVERSQTSNKRELPYRQIWNDTDEPVLRLITCSGAYVDGSYVENLIVYAG